MRDNGTAMEKLMSDRLLPRRQSRLCLTSSRKIWLFVQPSSNLQTMDEYPSMRRLMKPTQRG